ncbi:restriction endonuclease subunit S [Paenibacillus sp. 1-18]|uniref:restriction endonuclease subunit S n=1 Tax=Paenibacillus sp. 1-18 TaxID=1333846 RepID=UPI00046ECACA|nr:restriction endonuclease subunit S [Paenibacillus sp. 1-18]
MKYLQRLLQHFSTIELTNNNLSEQQLLTRGIGHTEFKQTELGGIPFLWSIKKIGEITEVKTGGTPSRTNNSYWENGTIPWMSSGEINLREVYNVKEKITEQGYRKSNTTLLPIGTVISNQELVAEYSFILAKESSWIPGPNGRGIKEFEKTMQRSQLLRTLVGCSPALLRDALYRSGRL